MQAFVFMRSLLLLTSLSISKLTPCHGIDRITPTQSLSGNQTLVSAGEVFELGFFSRPGYSELYIGIWYKQISPRTVVWVARDLPVLSWTSPELRISDDGELALFDGVSINPTWSTYSSNPSSAAYAVLLDQGNLVLLPNGSSSSPFSPNPPPVWQSFDHPGDTWIPGMRIGFNKVTQIEVYLTSWKDEEDPAPGTYSLRLGSNRSLEWNMASKRGILELPSMNNLVFVDNQNESYVTFSQYDSTEIAKIVEEEPKGEIQQQLYAWYNNYTRFNNNASLFSRYVLDATGQIQLLLWIESTQKWLSIWQNTRSLCEINGYCGAYASCREKSGSVCNCLTGFVPRNVVGKSSESVRFDGCHRRSPLRCQKPDWFLPKYNVGLPDNPETSFAQSSDDCETSCLRYCSCSAYSYSRNQCSHWFGGLTNLQQDVPKAETIFIKLAASEFSSSEHNNSSSNSKKKGILIGSVVGSIVLLVLAVFIILRWRKQKLHHGKLMEGSLLVLTHKDLKIITKNFSEKLGEGGFGSVYKGTLLDSSLVAVKKLERLSFRQSENQKQFLAEVRTLGTIQHINLVGLRGFSSDNSTLMLVYDYMPNGSVASHLFKGKDGSNGNTTLNWKMRYNIALGTAKGLAYIHEKCRECIIHCDVKPDNVLLDSKFRPIVADFGMAKLFGKEFSRVLTTFRGTIGYLAPEWISGEAITAKADVYSYGMVLLELVSGRRNSQRHECIGHYFPIWVANVINEYGNVAELLDPRLQGDVDIEEVERVCRVALWCIQDDEGHRPTMSQIVYILEQVLEVNIPPIPRILQAFVDPDP